MRGLLVKEWVIVRQEKRTLAMLIAFGGLMCFVSTPAFAVFYIAMVAGMMALGTMAYDEADHGYCFLLTLPFSRRDYVREKYLFCGTWTATFTVVATMLCLSMSAVQGGTAGDAQTLQSGAAALAAVLVMDAVMIPLRLKFGAEKSRIVLYLAAAAVAILGLLFEEVGRSALIRTFLEGMSPWVAPLAALAMLFVSERLSEGIMQRKEF